MINSLTLLSVNKNNYAGLLTTLNSLYFNITNQYFDHIIIDGESSDFTISLQDLNSFYNFKFISEKDTGIYNAMNKGISMALGNRLLFLNSGDSIIHKTCFNKFITSFTSYDLVYSNIIKTNRDGSFSHIKFPKDLSLNYMICYGLPHQATIINKSLFQRIGLYNEDYKIISDWVFFMEAIFIHKVSYKHVDLTVVNFDGSGISNQSIYLKTIIKEQLNYLLFRFPDKIQLYKTHNPYVKKYFRTMPRWKRYIYHYIFMKLNYI